jgi:hypothetical protein
MAPIDNKDEAAMALQNKFRAYLITEAEQMLVKRFLRKRHKEIEYQR